MATGKEIVLVTGGAGFIGSHVVEGLLARACRVVVLDNFTTGRRENLSDWEKSNSLRVIEGDVTGDVAAALSAVTKEWGKITRAVHLAAQTSVTVSIEQPLVDLKINLEGTLRVLEFCRSQGARKCVFASSAAVYGDAARLPAAETAPCRPLSPYGASKLAAEGYLRLYSEVLDLPATSLRFFNVYGPRQDPRSPYSGVITVFFGRALRGEGLTIFGDGKQTRDFIYVKDVAHAILAALFSKKGAGESLNVATGRETSVSELARQIVKTCGSRSRIHHADARPGEIRRSRAKVSKAKTLLGFSAKVKLEKGLAETGKWFGGASPKAPNLT